MLPPIVMTAKKSDPKQQHHTDTNQAQQTPTEEKRPAKRISTRRELVDLTPNEYEQLTVAWLNGCKFASILHAFNHRGDRADMEADDLRRQWNRLHTDGQRFSKAYRKLKAHSVAAEDGTTEEQLLEMAQQNYSSQHGAPFKYKSAWLLLRDHPKGRATMGLDEVKPEPQSLQPIKSPTTAHATAPSCSSKGSSAAIPSERKPDIPSTSTRPKSKIPSSADVKPNIAKRTPSTIILPSEPRDTPPEPTRINIITTTTTKQSSTTSASTPSKPKNPPDNIKPSSHKRAIHEVDDEHANHARQGTDGKRVKELVPAGDTLVPDMARAKSDDIDRLQLEVRHLEVQMEYERLEMDIMEKDLTTCTDEYEKEFYRYKKKKILAGLKFRPPPDLSAGTPLMKTRRLLSE